jgi:hypothetical protein
VSDWRRPDQEPRTPPKGSDFSIPSLATLAMPAPRDIEQAEAKTTKDQTIQKRTEPAFIEPMQCKAVPAVPASEKWTFEVKFDGYRCIAVKREREATLFSRHKKVLNKRFPGVVEALVSLKDDLFSTENLSSWIHKVCVIATYTKQSFAGSSDLFLRLRFTTPKWETFAEFVD